MEPKILYEDEQVLAINKPAEELFARIEMRYYPWMARNELR